MTAKDFIRSLATEVTGVSAAESADKAEARRIQEKQGGHHMPPSPDDGPPLDDTDRNTDRIIKPGENKRPS